MLLLIFVVSVASPSAFAQDSDVIKRVRIVVPTARGRKQYGGARLSRSLRRTLTESIGPLIPSRALRKAQRKLGLKGRKKWGRRALGRAGREVGADYVLYTSIKRKGWLYTARARLVNTITGQVQMDFRSQYYDPAKEAADRGQRIGARTLLKMQTLAEEGQLLATGTPPDASAPAGAPPPAAVPPSFDETPSIVAPPSDPRPSNELGDPATGLEGEPAIESPPSPAPSPPLVGLEPSAPPPPPFGDEPTNAPMNEARVDEPLRTDAPAAEAQIERPLQPSATSVEVDIIRFEVGGGAGLLRRYDVSSAAVDDSGLSYPLDPTSLVQAGVDLLWPSVGLGAELDFAFRPVRYEVGIANQAPDRPGGLIINGAGWMTYHFELAGSGRYALRLIPKVGARIDVAPVDEHSANFVISSTAIAVAGGLGLRWPVNRTLEIGLAVDGGWVASYSEDPATSGDGGAGFTVGGDLDLRIWLTSTIGIAIDSRYRFLQVSFDGAPTRQLPTAEQGRLENVTVSTQDLLTSLGIALRF